MATADQANALPLLYNDLVPLSSQEHADYRVRRIDSAPFLKDVHAVPLTVEEFILAQRFYPIIFSVGENPVPLALMGLNQGVNVFVEDKGELLNEVYVPAYIRRFPFMLARLDQGSEELSLCFDPSSEAVGAFDEGEALFVDGQPSDVTKNLLAFNEQFEIAGQKTGQFLKELAEMKLLMDGEVTIQPEGADKPFVYRGFQMIDENKLRELRGDQLRKMMQSGMLPVIHAHLFSLSLVRDIFALQVSQGKMAVAEAA
ncbi:SapC family protein [Aquisediminimonas sediminicola]|uniref:SapC family protein n=1 Tax=Alteraquisediminimonas sediminicola TaxID=2676787 RepID=UPI001C8DDE39|nr:SapC family protein [Aquisediminimonas sediminicola]